MTEYRMPDDLGGEYRFHVGRSSDHRYRDGTDAYAVELPHQCDAWTITAAHSRDQAIAEMERFVAEAQVALARLREVE